MWDSIILVIMGKGKMILILLLVFVVLEYNICSIMFN